MPYCCPILRTQLTAIRVRPWRSAVVALVLNVAAALLASSNVFAQQTNEQAVYQGLESVFRAEFEEKLALLSKEMAGKPQKTVDEVIEALKAIVYNRASIYVSCAIDTSRGNISRQTFGASDR
jgi:ketopantoate reductase